MSKCTKCGTKFTGSTEDSPKGLLCQYCQIDVLRAVLIYVQRNTRDERTLQVVTMTLEGHDPTQVLREGVA